MQYVTGKARIQAEFDRNTGAVEAMVQGDNLDLCILLGSILRQVAAEWGRKTGQHGIAKVKALKIVNEIAMSEMTECTYIDLSGMRKEPKGEADNF